MSYNVTYLTVVNNVLKRLREGTVSSVDNDEYTSLIGMLVNDAKEEVENSWDWSTFRTTIDLTFAEDEDAKEIDGSLDNFTILHVYNDTDNNHMREITGKQLNSYKFGQDNPPKGVPDAYAFNRMGSDGLSSDGDSILNIFPIPSKSTVIKVQLVIRPTDLVNIGDTLKVPSRPVELLAYAKAIEERGEDGGVSSASAYAIAQKSLQDAIAFDAAKHPEETIFYVV